MHRIYYGQFAFGGVGYSLEGDDSDCLYVERLMSPTTAEPVCVITGRDRDSSWEVLTPDGRPLPAGFRRDLIDAAVQQYRMWLVEH